MRIQCNQCLDYAPVVTLVFPTELGFIETIRQNNWFRLDDKKCLCPRCHQLQVDTNAEWKTGNWKDLINDCTVELDLGRKDDSGSTPIEL